MTNKIYIFSVSLLTFFLPVVCFFIEAIRNGSTFLSFDLFGKWFIFFAVGFRLFIAGIKQIKDPGFTAKHIFQIQTEESFPIVRELGFANLCFGLIGIVSLFLPQWRIVSAFGSGLYYGIAGLQHLIKKPAGTNEKFALATDLIIFGILLLYFVKSI
ncbi:DUF6790 family protein [Flavobacterium humi]|uniref:DUF4345 domain-containing protein n=1 Tax=Flavobacterium humi TaxID=2562683 RepID=A0A4Z0L6K6_9FLAO|nr:DUF6790 family protein [Flavobacterium humi]TGD58146.1 hypothetical protein E4635_09070 [Flavobacterium humi]